MRTSNNVVLPLLVASILVTGCGRGPEVPLDNRTLDVMRWELSDSMDSWNIRSKFRETDGTSLAGLVTRN